MAALADASGLVALLDRKQAAHARVVATTTTLTGELVTTCAAFTEAMHLIGRVLGAPGQDRLWRLRSRGTLDVAELPGWERTEELMLEYRDTPMALADGTLVAVAEMRGIETILSLDGHFRTYRFRKGRTLKPFKVLPGTE